MESVFVLDIILLFKSTSTELEPKCPWKTYIHRITNKQTSSTTAPYLCWFRIIRLCNKKNNCILITSCMSLWIGWMACFGCPFTSFGKLRWFMLRFIHRIPLGSIRVPCYGYIMGNYLIRHCLVTLIALHVRVQLLILYKVWAIADLWFEIF
jgi:hypothetical protein